jgi:hypothetical protein
VHGIDVDLRTPTPVNRAESCSRLIIRACKEIHTLYSSTNIFLQAAAVKIYEKWRKELKE